MMPRHRLSFALFLFTLVLSLGAALALAGEVPVDEHGLPLWQVRQWDDFPVRIVLPDGIALQQLLRQVPLSRFGREDVRPSSRGGLVVTPRVTEQEYQSLIDAGYAPERVRDVYREIRSSMERHWADQAAKGGSTLLLGEKGVWHTHAQIGTLLDDIATNHPDIARTFTWGTSVQGRELWGIVISDSVQSEQAEPEVRLSSTMHGDEPPGMEMLLYLAQYLTDNYGQPGYEDVTDLVDNYEIHIMPLFNPDGYVAGTRYNANDVDLNRNFPEPAGSHPTQEIETLNFMSYANTHHFVISENGHSGALVVNYPWDYTYDLTPDNDAIVKLSLEYSTYNTPMYNGAFDQGITNGAAWYVVTGSLQDWSYDQTDCIDVTIEYYDTKWPDASVLDGLWDDNRESFMHFIRAARYGVNGVVYASDTGQPLAATVTVAGNAKPVHTDPDRGDYYKLLDTGTYDITFSADGYLSKTITGVSTTWGTSTVLNVVLDPVAHGDITGHVYALGGTPLTARVDAYLLPANTLVATVYSDASADGAYTLGNLVYGDYRIVCSAAGHTTEEVTVTLDAASVVAPPVTLGLSVDVTWFSDDAEGGTAQWTGDWGVEEDAAAGVYGFSDSPGGNYADSSFSPFAMAQGVDLSRADTATLSYLAHWDIETDWDAVQFQVSTDGGVTWTAVQMPRMTVGNGQGAQPSGEPIYEGQQTAWVEETLDLAPWLGETDVRFRFLLMSDGSVTKDGFHFDDFVISGTETIDTTGAGDDLPGVTRLVGAWPNPFNPTTTLAYTLGRDADVRLALYDVQGRRVRTLVAGRQAAGAHQVRWDGRTDQGVRAASGVYFARLSGDGVDQTLKVMLVK